MAKNYKFVYSAEEAALAGVHGPMDLTKLNGAARSLALVPISTFEVGAVGLAESGQVYLGVNVEFEGLPLHHSIHAEQFLVANLALSSEKQLKNLAVSADGDEFGAPCGHCRQFYLEMRKASEIEIRIRKPNTHFKDFVSLETLLPDRFGPESKGQDFPLLLEEQNNNLVLSNPADEAKICSDPECINHLECRALTAANKSYAPYTESPSGVALICKDDETVYRGWYIESVAYNPSLGPVQAALVDFMARGNGKKFKDIEKVLLVEMEDAKVSQKATAKILLEKIAPNCNFKVLPCEKKPKEN